MRRSWWSGTCWQIMLSDRPAARMRLAPSNKALSSMLAANSERLAKTAATSAMPAVAASSCAAGLALAAGDGTPSRLGLNSWADE
jgi:hypothetical protein